MILIDTFSCKDFTYYYNIEEFCIKCHENLKKMSFIIINYAFPVKYKPLTSTYKKCFWNIIHFNGI